MIDFNNFLYRTKNADDAILKTMDLLLRHGKKVKETILTNSTGSSIEIENLQFAIENPLDRICINKITPFNLISAVGRFTWMMAGNDRTEDIAFYQPKVRAYSDNLFTIAGSDYGKRIFDPIPGIDQLKNVIDLLKKDPLSRRAVIPIFSPQDSGRLGSKDIPCAFGLGFLVRDGELHSTLIMRSNNGLLLLPTNIFEFSLIGEIVARELGVEYTQYIHNSLSMHIFEKDLSKLEGFHDYMKTFSPDNDRPLMPRMPSTTSPLSQAKKLAQLEALLRNENVLTDVSSIDYHLNKAKTELNEYWFEFFLVLCIGVLLHAKQIERASILAQDLPAYFKKPIMSYLEVIQKSPSGTLDSFLSIEKEKKFARLKKEFSLEKDEKNEIIDIIDAHVDNIVKDGVEVDRKEFKKLIKIFSSKSVVAARTAGNKKIENSEDLWKISQQEVLDELRKIKDKK